MRTLLLSYKPLFGVLWAAMYLCVWTGGQPVETPKRAGVHLTHQLSAMQWGCSLCTLTLWLPFPLHYIAPACLCMTETCVRFIMFLWDWISCPQQQSHPWIHHCRYLVIGSIIKVTPRSHPNHFWPQDKNTLENLAFYNLFFLVALFWKQNLQSH